MGCLQDTLAAVPLPLASLLLQRLALRALQNDCTSRGAAGGGAERRDLAGNFTRFGGLKEFVTYHPLPFSVGAEQPAAILRREPIIRPYFSRLLVSEQCESYLNLILRLSARLLAGPRQPPLRQRYLSYRGGLHCRQQCHLVIYGKLRGNISEEFH